MFFIGKKNRSQKDDQDDDETALESDDTEDSHYFDEFEESEDIDESDDTDESHEQTQFRTYPKLNETINFEQSNDAPLDDDEEFDDDDSEDWETPRALPFFHKKHRKFILILLAIIIGLSFVLASPQISEVNTRAKRLYAEAQIYINKGEDGWITINEKAMNAKLKQANDTAKSLFVNPATRAKIHELTEYSYYYSLMNHAQTELLENRNYLKFEKDIKLASTFPEIKNSFQYKDLLKTEEDYLASEVKQANYNRVYLDAVTYLNKQTPTVQADSSIYVLLLRTSGDNKTYKNKKGKACKKFFGTMYSGREEIEVYLLEDDAMAVSASDYTRKKGLLVGVVGTRKGKTFYADSVSWYPSLLTKAEIREKSTK